MPSAVWALLIVLFSCWFITRLVAWIVIWVCRRFLKIDVSIGKVAFFSLRKVKIFLNKNTTLEIDKIWCSSSLVSNEIRKPIAICLGDVRLQTEAQDGQGEERECPGEEPPPSQTKKPNGSRIVTIMSVMQFIGVHVEKVNVMLLKVPFQECLLHLSVQEVAIDCPVEDTGQSLMLNVQSVSCKVLKNQTSQPCIAEVSFSKTIFVHLEKGTILPPKSLKMIISKPQMMFTEGFLAHLQHLKSSRKKSRTVAKQQSFQSLEERLKSISGYLPRNILWKIEDTAVVIRRDSTQSSQETPSQEEGPDFPPRNLSVNIKLVQISANQDLTTTSPFYADTMFTMCEFQTSSPQARFANLNRVEATLKVRGDLLEFGGQVFSAYFFYHHEEILYWAAVLRKLTTPKQVEYTEVSIQAPKHAQNAVMTEFLSTKTIKADVEVWDLSASVAMATCSGYVGGLRHSKLTVNIQPGAPTSEGKENSYLKESVILMEFQLNALYCKLGDSPVTVDDMSSKIHHWDTLLYLGLITCKLGKSYQDVMLDAQMDDLQVEWSTTAVNVAIQLLSAMNKSCPIVPKIRDEGVPRAGSKIIDLKAIASSYSVNFKCTNVNLFACNNYKVFVMFRVDSVDMDMGNKQSTVNINGAKLVSAAQKNQHYPVRKSIEVEKYCCHLKEIKAHIRSEFRELSISLSEEVYIQWDTGLHMCFYKIMQDFAKLKSKISGSSTSTDKHPRHKVTTLKSQPPYSINIKIRANMLLRGILSRGHKATLSTPEFTASIQGSRISLFSDQCSIAFDEHDIFQMQGASISTRHHSEELKLKRKAFDILELPTNTAWAITFDKFSIIFPYKYNFAKCLQEVLAVKKFIKTLHFNKKKPFTVDSPLPPDVIVRAKNVHIQICDDPFEVKLGDNCALLVDEYRESAKRLSAMDKRIQELRKQHGLLPASKVSELYSSLHQRNSDIYVKRSQAQYTTHPLRTALATWKMEEFELIAMADKALHGKENCVKHMKEIDKDSPYPEEGLEFNTLFCRMINAGVKNWIITLRDYPQPFFDFTDFTVWGRFMAAEQEGAPRAKREATVEIPGPWEDLVVQKNMPALKFYHDFSGEATNITIAYGSCWEPCIAQVSLALDLINKPSVDPSPPLPFWDKVRLLFHGRFTMAIEQMSWLYHASLDPYNWTEFMDWSWSDLIWDWTSAKFVFKCNFDIYIRTASKYDDCRLLHLPNLRFCINLQWLCRGDPMDHHSVMPCAPDKKPEFSLEEHDSYRAFRSQNVNMSLSFETKSSDDIDGFPEIPCCLFYSSTLRFLEKIKMCMMRISRPIKRGKLYKMRKPKKKVLSRHYRNVTLSMNFHMVEVCYWVSFAKQHGMELLGYDFSLGLGMHLDIVHASDNLIHRPQTNWSIKKLFSELHNAQMWLCSANPSDGQEDALNISMRLPPIRSYFLTVSRLLYEREEEKLEPQQPIETEHNLNEEEEEERPTHRVQVYDLKGTWSFSNRNVMFGLFDGYLKAKTIKRNVSSEALKGFKVEGTQTPLKGRTHSLNASSPCLATPSPQSRIQLGHAYSLLQKLVSETDSKFVAFTEEPSGGNMEQLHGVSACQTDDVLKRNWLIELHNSQMKLKGCETSGYVIVSASKAQILSCQHQPVWRDRQLRSKTTWMGSVECMQYYATVEGEPERVGEETVWLTLENIEDRVEEDFEGTPEMVGSGQSVGGVVTKTIGATGVETADVNVQLQRIISRCKCQFFYASYGEADPNTLPEVPPPPSEDDKYLERTFEEGVDAFTLLHHDLNICTNSLQYAMILDIVNNLLLYVEPKKKQFTEKLLSKRFEHQLYSKDDQKTPILLMQENLRQHIVKFRQLERDLYNAQRTLDENPFAEGPLQQSEELMKALNDLKEQTIIESEELGVMISCYKESQLQIKHKMKAQNAKHGSLVVRRNEVCFKHAQWRLTDADGQIGLADLVLRNFLYCKINNNDDSGCHQLELGWAKMQNLLPNSIYKDVLVPQDPLGKGHLERQVALRILCRVKPPVGGISVKEHVEVNVVPLTIQLTNQFFNTLMKFFFPGRNVDAEDEKHDEQAAEKSKKKDEKEKKSGFKKYVNLTTADTDIDKMKDRAARNNTFLYVKIPEVPMKISYKGEKEKNIADVHDIAVVLPPVEFHNQTWTWLDLLLAVKNNSKRALLSQAIKQKLHMRSRMSEEMVTDVQQEEDKAKMLLGAKLLAGSEKPSSKKNLFGKSGK